jgi:hypothetical protein
MATALIRRIAGILSALFVAGLLVAGTGGTARAADGFRYWNYFHVKNGSYAFATTGPSGFTPADGSVEAYRYGLSSTAAGLQPRADAGTYPAAKICKGTPPKSGQKRVGVLLDFGTKTDAAKGETPPAPRAACAVVPLNATGQQVLAAVAKVRVQKQLVCGIDGYPVTSCTVTVKNPPAAAPQQDVAFELPPAAGSSTDASSASPAASSSSSTSTDDGGIPWPLVGVVAALVLLGGGALALARSRRNA